MIKTFEIKKQFTSYRIILTEDQFNVMCGYKRDFYGCTNESLILELQGLEGVMDAWFKFTDINLENNGLIVRVSADKDNKRLWTKIQSTISKKNVHVA